MAGAAIEMLHSFALLHDDVMDRATTRRGMPVAHVAFAGAYRASQSGGDADAFGDGAAILAGDLAFVWADALFDSIVAPAERLRAARHVFNQLRVEVIAGQYLDLLGDAGGCRPDEAALTVALLKSARYTVTRPLQLGAALAGGRQDTLVALGVYGDAIGVAFQMRDDILDIFGNPELTGKDVSGDLRDGKRTLLLEQASQLSDSSDAAYLCEHVGNPSITPAEVGGCRQIIARSGALASVEALISARYRIALNALTLIDDNQARHALTELAQLCAHRDA